MSELDRLLTNEPALPVSQPVPFSPVKPSELDRLLKSSHMDVLHRAQGEAPQAFVSQEGAPYPPYYGHMPGEATAPVVNFEPTEIFKEGNKELPFSQRADLPFEQAKLAAGGLANKAIDFGKGLVGGIVDPETLIQFPLIGRLMSRVPSSLRAVLKPPAPLSKPISELERLATSAPQVAPAPVKPVAPAEFLGTQKGFKTVPDFDLYNLTQDIPSHPKGSTVTRETLEEAGFAVQPKPPLPPGKSLTPFEPPEPPERLGNDGTYAYEPWRQNYDVHLYDYKDPTLSWWERFKRKLPADYAIATKQPESPVIGTIDKLSTEMMNFTDDLVHEKVPGASLKELSAMDKDLWVTEEAKAYAMWEQSRKAPAPLSRQLAPQPGQVGMQVVGLSPEKSIDDILGQLNPQVAKWIRLFQERRPIEQAARRELGLPELDDVPYPYVPRMMQSDWDRVMMLQRGDQSSAVSGMSTTIKGFQQSRVYPTMNEGHAHGMAYEDPTRAILMRLMLSKQLEYTANMMRELKGKVIFESRDAAHAELLRRRGLVLTQDMKTPKPVGEPVAVRGLPGQADKTWYVPSKPEALSLYQHLKGHQASAFGEWSAALNQLFRNPNLFNPAPHVIKNMGWKYVIASTGLDRNPVKALTDLVGYAIRMPWDMAGAKPPAALDTISMLSRDATEYMYNQNPTLVARYEAVMPFSRTAKTSYENLKPYLERSKPWAMAQTIGKFLTGNAWSSKYVFSKADPAMKYSLWKQYLAKGMSDVAAANQVNIDLVRYTLTSELTDTWKNVPLNFFIPWRTGTIMATAKQLSSQPWEQLAKQVAVKVPLWALTRPFKTSLLIGAFLLGREAYYRNTGKTFHLPIDYVNGPLTQVVANPLTLPYVAASMYLMGPGADPVRLAGNIKDMFGVLKGTEDLSKVMEMYWGIAQMYGASQEFVKFAKSLDTNGVEGADYAALAHVVMGAATAEYTSYGYKPKHLEHYISDELLPYDAGVKQNIHENEARAAAAQLRKPTRDLRREAIQRSQEQRVRP